MDPTVIQYAGFVVAALILIWAVIELNRRLDRRKVSDIESLTKWVELDTTRPGSREELSPAPVPYENDSDETAEMRMRARQNGHHNGYHAESQRPQT